MLIYWTVGDIAKAAGIGPMSVDGWRQKGLITPVARTPFGIRLYDPEDIKRFLALRKKRKYRTAPLPAAPAQKSHPQKGQDG